jgi:hypothetical protein
MHHRLPLSLRDLSQLCAVRGEGQY